MSKIIGWDSWDTWCLCGTRATGLAALSGWPVGSLRLRCQICAECLELGRKEAGVAPWEGFESEIENAVEFAERDAHVEADFGGGEAVATGFLHDGEVEPADGVKEKRLSSTPGSHLASKQEGAIPR